MRLTRFTIAVAILIFLAAMARLAGAVTQHGAGTRGTANGAKVSPT